MTQKRYNTRSSAQQSSRDSELLKSRIVKQRELLQNLQKTYLKTATRQDAKKGGVAFTTHVDMKPEALSAIKQLTVLSDQRALCVPFPSGVVAFHLNTVKTLTKGDDEGTATFRITFHIPGVKTAGAYPPGLTYPKCTFVKELVFKMKSGEPANTILSTYTDVVRKMKQEKLNLAANPGDMKPDVLEGGASIASLPRVFARPNPRGAGRKCDGVLECYKNGFRFRFGGDKLDIPFNILRNAIFLPADGEIYCILHFHLHCAIMVGKKKHTDVQFYVEVCDDSVNINASTARFLREEDEVKQDEKEDENRRRLNMEFLKFVKACEEKTPIKFDRPHRGYEFGGVPGPVRTTVSIRPTEHCLVSCQETPFWVLNIEDIEIAICERVVLGQKNFDLILVPKDYKAVVRVDNVSVFDLDIVQETLTMSNLKYYEAPQAVNWPQVLKTIREADLIPEGEEGKWDPWCADNGWPAMFDLDIKRKKGSDSDDGGSSDDDSNVTTESTITSSSDDEEDFDTEDESAEEDEGDDDDDDDDSDDDDSDD